VIILGIYNIKGGVGKTATTVNLAYLAAHAGYRTLVWDLDPQAASSFYFRVKPKVKGGSRGLIEGKHELQESVKETDFRNLDLLPADFSYRGMDLVLDEAKRPTRQFERLLEPLAEEYDLIFLDCPPGITLVSEAVFRAADALVVPTIPTTLSERTLAELMEFVAEQPGLENLRVMPFFSMVDRRKRLHQELLETLPERFPQILERTIPYASDVERMGVHRMPLLAFAPRSQVAAAYVALWEEVLGRLGPR
jgi:cellulose biosynthesis protein BcsQ